MTTISDVIAPIIGSIPGVDPSVAGVILTCGVVILGIELFDTVIDVIFFMTSFLKA